MNILKTLFKYLTGQQFTLYMDGGGSGTSTSGGTNVNISELPEWARGYAKNTLEKTAALSETPYQTYGGDRIAGFSPMQQQAQQGAANMQTNQGTGAGMGIAGLAALGGLNQDYNGMQMRSQNFGNQSAAQYMSPYAMQALQPTLNEQARQAQIQGNQLQAKAVGQGAFGGSRQGLEQAENMRNLGIQQGNTIAQGMNTAYNNAQTQFNADQARNMQAQQANIGQQQFGANLGLQGLNTALQGANTLGALGGQQFQQGMDINKLQNAYGGQQQALQQQGLTQAYNDFLNQQNYPYKQLGFMSDMIRGLPVGQQSTQQIYTPDPSAAQQIGALGMGAYGLSKFMAEGGVTSSYADGGSVESTGNIESIVSKLSDQQLQQAMQAAKARGDMDEMEAIQSELGMRASERNGLASAVTPAMANHMAGGGVVAFKSGGLQDYMSAVQSAGEENIAPTQEERMAGVTGALPGIQSLYGDSATKPYLEEIKKERADLGKQKGEGEGLAWLAGAQALLQPGNKARAVAGAANAVGTNLAKASKDVQEANRQLRQSELTLATADQARKDGQISKASELYEKGIADKKEAVNRKLSANEKLATIEGGLEQARIHTAASQNTDFKTLANSLYQAKVEAGAPETAATRAAANKEAADQWGKYPGSARAENAEQTAREKAEKSTQTYLMSPAGLETGKKIRTLSKTDPAEAQRLYEEQVMSRMGKKSEGGAPPAQPNAQPAQAPTAPPTKAVSILKGNPSAQNRAYFDQTFGAGAAARALGE
jgi:hypothetical protein